MKLTPVIVDFESFWSVTHSLTKMNPIAYVMHPDTEIISVAVKVGKHPTDVIFGEDNIRAALHSIDWSDKLVIGHNMSGFDAMILAWRFGIKPGMWGCTLAMAAPHHGLSVGGSLAKLVEHYGLGVKDQNILKDTKGRHLKDFSDDEIKRMEHYNREDTEQCFGLFRRLYPLTSQQEMKLIDMTIRMLVEPQFKLDTGALEAALVEEKERKRTMLLQLAHRLGEDTDDEETAVETIQATLNSAAKFGQLLSDLGCAVPTKISPRTGKEAPALSKTDEEFLSLREHDDPLVRAAVEARLGTKSTILESRIQAFLEAGDAAGGRLPVPLKYYGGHTGRWSGWGYNPQNLPRVSGKPTDVLRKSLLAPPGHKIVVCDLSGIELRVNHFLWQVPSSMELYRENPDKADLYKDFASRLYDVPVEEVTKAQRQVGKVAHLGLGFGSGYKTFVKVAKTMGGVDLTEEESRDIVTRWRESYIEIVRGWKKCQSMFRAIQSGTRLTVDPWGMCMTEQDLVRLPSGRFLRYPELREVVDEDGRRSWKFGQGRHEKFITGPKMDENLVQAIARDVIAGHALDVFKRRGYRPALMVHDELVYVVPEDQAEDLLALLNRVMRVPPEWWPELVLSAEGDIADSYGDAK